MKIMVINSKLSFMCWLTYHGCHKQNHLLTILSAELSLRPKRYATTLSDQAKSFDRASIQHTLLVLMPLETWWSCAVWKHHSLLHYRRWEEKQSSIVLCCPININHSHKFIQSSVSGEARSMIFLPPSIWCTLCYNANTSCCHKPVILTPILSSVSHLNNKVFFWDAHWDNGKYAK